MKAESGEPAGGALYLFGELSVGEPYVLMANYETILVGVATHSVHQCFVYCLFPQR